MAVRNRSISTIQVYGIGDIKGKIWKYWKKSINFECLTVSEEVAAHKMEMKIANRKKLQP
jgi:hypothetical protein